MTGFWSSAWRFLETTQASVLATLALLAVTGIYVFLTGRMARSIAAQVESFTRPIVSTFNGNAFQLPPGDELRIALGVGPTLLKDDVEARRFNIEATYRFGRKRYQETLPVDLSPYIGTTVPKSEFVIQMDRLVKAIQRQ